MSFEAVTTISVKITVWGLTPFRLGDIFQHFIGKICCLSIQIEDIYTLKMESAVATKHL
jgi:hypothetical protein